ncbi:hypothetical protein [Lysinibacillus sp. NPDC096212]|uniref:hypothetical protein n=1 Tax=Lysinibacillus sp. NPDC096212 TaxID=3364135 RepID=UPI0038088CE2
MLKGNDITITLRKSHVTKLMTIKKHLIGELYLTLQDYHSEKMIEEIQKKLMYIEGLNISQIAMLWFTSSLSNDENIRYLKRTIDLHTLLNNIST